MVINKNLAISASFIFMLPVFSYFLAGGHSTYFNKIEAIMFFISGVTVFFLLTKWLKQKSFTLISLSLILPALFVNIHGATQAVTADEPQYINAFSNMENATDLLFVSEWGFQGISKNLLQYRTTQLFLGNLFNILRMLGFTVDNTLGFQNRLMTQFYKSAHWALCTVFLLIILYIIWKWYIPNHLKDKKYLSSLLLGLLGMTLFTLPVNTLMSKVANYDGTSVYPCVIAILLAGIYAIHGNRKVAFGGYLFALLGVLEKTASAPFFLITLSIITFGSIKNNDHTSLIKRLIHALITWSSILLFYLLFSTFQLMHILSQANRSVLGVNETELTLGLAVFPFVFLYQALTTGKINAEAFHVENPYIALFSTWLAVFASAIVIYILYRLIKNIKDNKIVTFLWQSLFPKMLATILLIVIIISIIGTYFVPDIRVNDHFILPEYSEYFLPEDNASGVISFFYANSKLEHIILTIIHHYGVVIASLPTIILILMFLLALLLFKRKIPILGIYSSLLLIGSCMIPAIFAIGGQPSGERYYGIIINLMLISTIILLSNILDIENDNIPHKYIACAVAISCLILYELALYAPNIKVFNPLWNIQRPELKEFPQQNTWHIGEAMLWGEDYMFASHAINNYYKKVGMPDKAFDLYSNYGKHYLGDNKSNYIDISQLTAETFNENTWFSLSRFMLYRSPLPSFITEVEPYLKIQFNGMTAVYIYRGDQLLEYQDFFTNK